MARPKKEKKLVQYTIMLHPDIVKEIKDMAKSADLPPAALARNLVMLGLDDARLLHKVGLIRLLSGGRNKIEQIKEQFNFDSLNIFKKEWQKVKVAMR